MLYGVKPVIIAIVAQALWRLGRTVLTTKLLVATVVVAVALGFAGVNELAILFGSGGAIAIFRALKFRRPSASLLTFVSPAIGAGAASTGIATGATSFGLLPLFLFFLKVGSVLFGSGYVLIAFLRADLVERWQWLTESQLLDAVAVGQVTPGPVFTTATFIGYLLDGPRGATVATLGIFLPAFFFVAISGPLVPRLRRSTVAGNVFDGINVGSLALMAVVTVQLCGAAIVDVTTFLLAVTSAVLLVRFQVNSAYLVVGAALVGLLGVVLL
jgi:chromate transporter